MAQLALDSPACKQNLGSRAKRNATSVPVRNTLNRFSTYHDCLPASSNRPCLRTLRLTTSTASVTSFGKERRHRNVKVYASLQDTYSLPDGTLRLSRISPAPAKASRLMVFLPGTDGTGRAITCQLPSLNAAGYDVFSMTLSSKDRSNWQQLTSKTLPLLRELLAAQGYDRMVLFGESFGGAWALRVASAAPEMVEQVVLLNPATSFSQSLNGLSSFISQTNLLSLFPQVLYNAAQATLIPFLVDAERINPDCVELMHSLVEMEGPDNQHGARASSNGNSSTQQPSSPLPFQPYNTAVAANHRFSMLLNAGDLTEAMISRILAPTVILCSAKDRLLPSIQEGARLQRLLPKAARVILPDSSHAAMLELGFDLADQLAKVKMPADAAPHTPAHTSSASKAAGTSSQQLHSNNGNGVSPGANNGIPAASSVDSGLSGSSVASSSSSSSKRSRRSGVSSAPDPDGAEPLDETAYDEWTALLAPWRELVSPVVLGFDNLPPANSAAADRPMLFVGNHQRVGFYDTPLFVYEMSVRGYKVRGLAHRGHWAGPIGPFFAKFGAVKAGPLTAFRLLKNREKVLLFPGGAREVTKPRNADYKLIWKDEPDFVRLAAKCKAIIVPFSAVGADDAYDVVMDTQEVLDNPVLGTIWRTLYNRVDPSLDVSEAALPVTRLPGIGLPTPIPIPNLQRLYFKIEKPIDTAALDINLKDPQAVADLYAQVRQTVEQSMEDLLEHRSKDERNQVGPRLSKAFNSYTQLISAAVLGPNKP